MRNNYIYVIIINKKKHMITKKYIAIKCGEYQGIFSSWNEMQSSIENFSDFNKKNESFKYIQCSEHIKWKNFDDFDEAEKWISRQNKIKDRKQQIKINHYLKKTNRIITPILKRNSCDKRKTKQTDINSYLVKRRR